jgi:hypothetical protein
MRWRVFLDGEEADLEELADTAAADDWTIRPEGGRWELCSSSFAALASDDEVWRAASALLELVAGAASLAFGAQPTLRVSAIEGENVEGKRFVFGYASGSATLRGVLRYTVIRADGTVEHFSPGQNVRRWVAVAMKAPAAADALVLWATRPHDWATLYKTYERVRHLVGGDDEVVRRGWASDGQLERGSAEQRTAQMCSGTMPGTACR